MPNPWFEYIAKIRNESPELSYKQCFDCAKMTYMKQQKKIWYDAKTGKKISYATYLNNKNTDI